MLLASTTWSHRRRWRGGPASIVEMSDVRSLIAGSGAAGSAIGENNSIRNRHSCRGRRHHRHFERRRPPDKTFSKNIQ
jgi:hypothetical protein